MSVSTAEWQKTISGHLEHSRNFSWLADKFASIHDGKRKSNTGPPDDSEDTSFARPLITNTTLYKENAPSSIIETRKLDREKITFKRKP